jgi:hypothetical protein
MIASEPNIEPGMFHNKNANHCTAMLGNNSYSLKSERTDVPNKIYKVMLEFGLRTEMMLNYSDLPSV